MATRPGAKSLNTLALFLPRFTFSLTSERFDAIDINNTN